MIYIIITIFYGVVVSAFGFNPNDPGSNPGMSSFLFTQPFFLPKITNSFLFIENIQNGS